MGVPGQLQVDAVPGRLVHLHRLVREQHYRARGVPPAEGAVEVRTVFKLLTGDVVHPGQVEPGQLHPLVAQRPQAEPGHLLDPLFVT